MTRKMKMINETMLTKTRSTAISKVALFSVFIISFIFLVIYMFL